MCPARPLAASSNWSKEGRGSAPRDTEYDSGLGGKMTAIGVM